MLQPRDEISKNVQFRERCPTVRYIGALVLNILRPRQNGRHFPDDIFKCIFFSENVWTSFKISLRFVPNGPINNIPSLVQIMAWRRPGAKPLSEPMLISSPTYICVTRPQWVIALKTRRMIFRNKAMCSDVTGVGLILAWYWHIMSHGLFYNVLSLFSAWKGRITTEASLFISTTRDWAGLMICCQGMGRCSPWEEQWNV